MIWFALFVVCPAIICRNVGSVGVLYVYGYARRGEFDCVDLSNCFGEVVFFGRLLEE